MHVRTLTPNQVMIVFLVVVTSHGFSNKVAVSRTNVPGLRCTFRVMDSEMLRRGEKDLNLK